MPTDESPLQPSHRKKIVESLFKKHLPDLIHFLLKRRVWTRDAEDLAQDVYERALRTPKKPIENEAGYLFGIAHFVVQEHRVRQRRDRLRASGDTALEDLGLDSGGLSLEDVMAAEQAKREIGAALDALELEPMLEAVLLLRYRDGLSREEIATYCGLSLHQVERYLREARDRMRDWITRERDIR